MTVTKPGLVGALLSRLNWNQKARASPSAVLANLDDPPHHIHPGIPTSAHSKAKDHAHHTVWSELEDITHFAQTIYDQDGLRSIHNHEFMGGSRFQKAYQRGVQAVGDDYHWHWRVHVALWAAHAAAFLDGDFVECGVNRGFMSSAIMTYLDWNTLDKRYFLLDTFRGIDLRYVTEQELADGIADKNAQSVASNFYTLDLEAVYRNFSEWSRVVIIPGSIPETLDKIIADRISFVHMDLNCSQPEVAAMRFLWAKLVPGALVVLDDYAYNGYRSQRVAMDQFARSVGVGVLSMPTGQGLLIKPPNC